MSLERLESLEIQSVESTRGSKKTKTIEYQSLGDLGSIIQDHHRQFIIDAVNDSNTITLEELKVALFEEFGGIHSISATTLCNFLNNFERITLKSTPMEEKRNDEETRRKKKEFILSLQPEGILYNQKCIFIDEVGSNINMIKGHARSKAGSPAVVIAKTKKATNVSILFVLSVQGVESGHLKIVKGDTTDPIFKEFVQQLIEKLNNANSSPYHLVMDNVRIHDKPISPQLAPRKEQAPTQVSLSLLSLLESYRGRLFKAK